jgi:hypothetical protein
MAAGFLDCVSADALLPQQRQFVSILPKAFALGSLQLRSSGHTVEAARLILLLCLFSDVAKTTVYATIHKILYLLGRICCIILLRFVE